MHRDGAHLPENVLYTSGRPLVTVGQTAFVLSLTESLLFQCLTCVLVKVLKIHRLKLKKIAVQLPECGRIDRLYSQNKNWKFLVRTRTANRQPSRREKCVNQKGRRKNKQTLFSLYVNYENTRDPLGMHLSCKHKSREQDTHTQHAQTFFPHCLLFPATVKRAYCLEP